jgi:hypothetical protein
MSFDRTVGRPVNQSFIERGQHAACGGSGDSFAFGFAFLSSFLATLAVARAAVGIFTALFALWLASLAIRLAASKTTTATVRTAQSSFDNAAKSWK